MKSKKLVTLFLTAAMVVSCFAGCGSSSDGSGSANQSSGTGGETAEYDYTKSISVISREDGSGTRGAFIELFGIEEKLDDGTKVDNTTIDASITNNTSVMMSTVAGNEYSIGYISLGSLNETVKAVNIDGVQASVENIENDSYKIARPFNIVTGAELSDVATDFVNYILSDDGQAVVSDNGYIAVSDGSFESNMASGKVVVAGSSSVSPVMEKLQEAYLKINTNADIEIQTSDSTTGVQSTIDGICDIGMASRALSDEEAGQRISGTTIAMDGIAVIVNNNCPVNDLTSEQVKSIFTGETTKWEGVANK